MNTQKLLVSLFILFITNHAFSMEGDAEREQIRATISAHGNEIRVCYRDNQKSIKGAQGKIYIDFEVNDQGVMTKSEFNAKKSTLKNDVLLKCMNEKFKKWFFPAAPKGQVLNVLYPFAFKKN